MPISDYRKQKVQQWLIDAGRKCPSCKADAEKLLPTDLEKSLPREAVTSHGINGSVEVHDARIVCQECKFETVIKNLEELGLY